MGKKSQLFGELCWQYIEETGQAYAFQRWRASYHADMRAKQAAKARLLEQLERDWAALAVGQQDSPAGPAAESDR